MRTLLFYVIIAVNINTNLLLYKYSFQTIERIILNIRNNCIIIYYIMRNIHYVSEQLILGIIMNKQSIIKRKYFYLFVKSRVIIVTINIYTYI